MNLDERLDSLRAKHESLEFEIVAEEKRPHPDDIHIHELKKLKLLLKDQMLELGG